MLDSLKQDVSYALRNFRRSPGFVLIVVLVTGLGIRANTAIFSFANAVLLHQPFSYNDPATAVRLTLLEALGG